MRVNKITEDELKAAFDDAEIILFSMAYKKLVVRPIGLFIIYARAQRRFWTFNINQAVAYYNSVK
jgi:hypothetical protein